MNVSDRRTQAERSGQTRTALLDAARGLFGTLGYAAVSTTEIVAEAGVTRGALYHHFADKRELFRAVYEGVEEDLTRRSAAALTLGDSEDIVAALIAGGEAFLDACLDRPIRRIVLEDGPAVLGWAEWRAIGERHGLGVIEGALRYGVESGRLRELPVRASAHALLGALDELALWVATAEDPAVAREHAGESLRAIAASLGR